MSQHKPAPQPNLLHQVMLAALVENKQTVRTEIRSKRDKSGRWGEYTVDVSVPMLAGNVSGLNCDLAARRWLP